MKIQHIIQQLIIDLSFSFFISKLSDFLKNKLKTFFFLIQFFLILFREILWVFCPHPKNQVFFLNLLSLKYFEYLMSIKFKMYYIKIYYNSFSFLYLPFTSINSLHLSRYLFCSSNLVTSWTYDLYNVKQLLYNLIINLIIFSYLKLSKTTLIKKFYFVLWYYNYKKKKK